MKGSVPGVTYRRGRPYKKHYEYAAGGSPMGSDKSSISINGLLLILIPETTTTVYDHA